MHIKFLHEQSEGVHRFESREQFVEWQQVFFKPFEGAIYLSNDLPFVGQPGREYYIDKFNTRTLAIARNNIMDDSVIVPIYRIMLLDGAPQDPSKPVTRTLGDLTITETEVGGRYGKHKVWRTFSRSYVVSGPKESVNSWVDGMFSNYPPNGYGTSVQDVSETDTERTIKLNHSTSSD